MLPICHMTYWAHLQKLWAEPGSGNITQAFKICKLASTEAIHMHVSSKSDDA